MPGTHVRRTKRFEDLKSTQRRAVIARTERLLKQYRSKHEDLKQKGR